MSLALLKTTAKKNLLLLGIFYGVLVMYSSVMISMFSPESLDALNAMFTVLPPEMMQAFGFANVFTDYLGYLGSWLYGLIFTAFPLVYCIILGNRLMAKTVDNGSIASLLMTPISREKIVLTKGLYAFGSLAVLHALLFGTNYLISRLIFPEETFDAFLFFKLNLTVFLLNMTAMAISFFCSCVIANPRLAMGAGAGIPLIFLVFNMVGAASEKTAELKNLSFYGWYDPVSIAAGGETLGLNLVYLGITAVLLIGAVLIFRRRQLAV